MPNDDQYFLDLLSSVPNDVKRYSLEVADTIDKHVEFVASILRESLSSSPWIPNAARPRALYPKHSTPVHSSTIEQVGSWICTHKKTTAIAIIGVSLSGYIFYRNGRSSSKKRRAIRAQNGARQEVVVISGALNEAATRTICLDLEKRGFIIYMIARTAEEEQLVESESRPDIKALRLDLPDEINSRSAIDQFIAHLKTPRQAFQGAIPHQLRLRGLIIVPSTAFAQGSIEDISLDAWSDALNTRILSTVASTQAFHGALTAFKARILIMTPAIVPALSPPSHGIETSVVAALDAFTSSLYGELSPQGVSVCHFKLGNFDWAASRYTTALKREDWLSRSALTAYDSEGFGSSDSGTGVERSPARNSVQKARGEHVRELNHAVFDALTMTRPRRIWRVGTGSLVYDVIGKFVPAGVVGYMLGLRRLAHGRTFDGSESTEWEEIDASAGDT
ncbi:MAG: hypothetical protein M1814_002034 [Vezdaea aestivalis]|nr:MAG: hypothetical protein M1814_002034 [Vezdaea aestivalis]